MTRTSEMREIPDPREVNRLLRSLESPGRNEYSAEIESRAIGILRDRLHREWSDRVGAQSEARDLRRWNKVLTWVVVLLVMALVGAFLK